MKKSKLAALTAAPVAALVLTLGGCANSPATAARIGGQTISEHDLDDAATRMAAAEPGADAQGARAAVLSILMRGDAARKLEQERGISVNDSERVSALGSDYPDQVRDNPATKAIYDGFADFTVLESKLGEPAFSDAVQGMNPVVNPRYGFWDNSHFRVQMANGSLSTKYLPDK